jgi:hypothetical protein
MHQQVRTSIRTTRREGIDGEREEESLVKILTVLKGLSLRSAGRVKLENGDEQFVFSVVHPDDHDRDVPDQMARQLLEDAHYNAEIIKVGSFLLDHRKGALLRCITDFEKPDDPVIEVHVGAADPNRKIPVQLVTRSMLQR